MEFFRKQMLLFTDLKLGVEQVLVLEILAKLTLFVLICNDKLLGQVLTTKNCHSLAEKFFSKHLASS